MIRRVFGLAVVALLCGCPNNPPGGSGGGSAGGAGAGGGAAGGSGGGQSGDAGPLSCRPCVSSAECDLNGSCTQYSGDSFCAKNCQVASDCASTEGCVPASDFAGIEVKVCLPLTGSCTAGGGCGVCTTGTTCNLALGICEEPPDAGELPSDGGPCGAKTPPAAASCCHACVPGSSACQTNGCFGGWWCDEANLAACSCKTPPTSCTVLDAGTTDAGTTDAGTQDAGPKDAGAPVDGGFVRADGGSVNLLYFAVVGDTRPASPINAPANYPTAIITKIFADLTALNPRPQFIVGTGDYQYSNPISGDAAIELGFYLTARAQFPGVMFASMGNHECLSPTLSNCVGTFIRPTYDAFINALVKPLGKTLPYYSVPIQTSTGLARFILVACNAWDATQKAWLQNELNAAAQFKIIVRHEAIGTAAPCTAEMDPMIAASPYNLLLVGHTHLFAHRGNELVIGMGGAPISGSTPYGFVTIQQLAAGGWHVVQYDSTTNLPVSNFTIP